VREETQAANARWNIFAESKVRETFRHFPPSRRFVVSSVRGAFLLSRCSFAKRGGFVARTTRSK